MHRGVYIAALLAAAGLLAPAQTRLLAGLGSVKPEAVPGPHGDALRFAAAVMREAARREGFEIDWREVHGMRGPEAALERGEIEVYPTALETEERRARFFLSEPWWRDDLAVLVRADGPRTQGALAGKRILLASAATAATARRAYPRTVFEAMEADGARQAAVRVCRGLADGALMAHRDAIYLMGARPEECARATLALVNTSAGMDLSLMTVPGRARLAERLRARIDEMAGDGTLTRLAAAHPGIPASSVTTLAERIHTRSERRMIALFLGAGAILVIAAATFTLRMRRIRSALEASERRYRGVFESMQEGFVVGEVVLGEDGHPQDWRIVEANPKFESMTGFPPGSMNGRTYLELFGKRWPEYWLVSLGSVALSRRTARFENYGPDGRYYEAVVYCPAPMRFAAMFRDATERRKAEEALRDSENRYRTLFESMREGFHLGEIIRDGAGNAVDWRVLAVNSAFESLLGIPRGEAVGRLGSEVFACIDRERWVAVFADVASSGKTVELEAAEFGRHWQSFAYCTRPGEFALIFSDVTERMKAERDLRVSNDDLQAYAYTVSHDLQEPLRMVTAYLDLFERRQKGALDEQSRMFIQVIRTGALRMTAMLGDLLQFSRAGQDAAPPGDVDARAAAQRAVDALRHKIDETGAEVVIGTLPVVRAWKGRLDQVFQNLIDNALKYSRPGVPPRVEITAERQASMWRFCVQDNGIGFQAKYADRIFRVFQRLHGREQYSGTGIGLAISKRIVERHGGQIWVDWTEPGQGSRFCFTLPARPVDGPAS